MRSRVTCLFLVCVGAGLVRPAVEMLAQEPELLPGGTFEFGVVGGFGSFGSKSQLDSCPWYSVRAGHRFDPLRGNPRIQMGFRAGWETCISEHPDVGRIDLIHVNMAFLFGFRTSARM